MPQPPMPQERTGAEPASAAARASRATSAPASLPEAERRRRRRELWISVGVGAALAALFLLEPIAGLTQSASPTAASSCSSTPWS